MDLNSLLVISVAIWALMRFLIQPWVETNLKTVGMRGRIAKATTVAIVDQVLKTSCVVMITTATLLVFLFLASLTGRTGLTALLQPFKTIQEGVSAVGSWVRNWMFATLVLALAYLRYRQGKKSYTEQVREHVQVEIERLARERREQPESWEEIEPTAEMSRIEALMSEIREEAASLCSRTDLDPEARDTALGNCRARYGTLAQLRDVLDLERRVDVAKMQLNRDVPLPVGRLQKLKQFFVSEGLYGDMKLLSKTLSKATLALTLVACVGVRSAQLAQGLNQSINMLVIKSSMDSASQDLAVASSKGVQPEAWTKEDDEAARHIASHYVQSLARSRIWSLAQTQARATQMARQHTARAAILGVAQETVLEGVPAVATETIEQHLVEKSIKPTAHSDPGAWAKIKKAALAHKELYGKPIAAGEPLSQLVKEAIRQALEVTSSEATNEFTKQAAKLRNDVGKDVITRIVHGELNRTMASMARDASLDEALERVLAGSRRGRAPLEVRLTPELRHDIVDRFPEERVLQAMMDRPPTVPEVPDPHVQINQVEVTAKRMLTARSRDYTPGEVRARMEALASFSDHFPGQLSAEENTPLGKMARELERSAAPPEPLGSFEPQGGGGGGFGGGGGGGSSKSPKVSRGLPPRVAMERARSFGTLRGFFRVGGVLIGRDPEQPQGIAINGFRWTTMGGNVSLFLKSAQGREFGLGPYPASTVNLALRYAADGRATAVTMASARPLMELKILLHPALVDTPIGCRAIELDRFVDTYARAAPEVKAAEQAARLELALYQFAWYQRQLSVLEKMGEDAVSFSRMARRAVMELRNDVAGALRNRSLFASKDTSVMLAKSEFFEADLANRTRRAWAASRTPEEFAEKLGSWTAAAKEDIKTWLGDPASFEVWSGVRERTYRLDPELTFLRPGDDSLQPFEFTLQTSFTTAPLASKGNTGDVGVDPNPYEFTAQVRDVIRRLVSTGARGDVVQRMREFVLLQRLFRNALNGHFSEAFPIEKLVALERATAAFRPVQRTMRWNVRPGALEMRFGALARSIQQIELREDASGAVSRCMALLQSAATLSSISQASWKASCDFSEVAVALGEQCTSGRNRATCQQSGAMDALNSLSQARELRANLGVARDDEQARIGVQSCGGVE